jgi:hypothetical protein
MTSELRFPLMHVGPHGEAMLEARVDAAFEPRYMTVPNEFAKYFRVLDIIYDDKSLGSEIDGKNMFAMKDGAPASIFAEVHASEPWVTFSGDTFEQDHVVKVRVRNDAPEIKVVWATIHGKLAPIEKSCAFCNRKQKEVTGIVTGPKASVCVACITILSDAIDIELGPSELVAHRMHERCSFCNKERKEVEALMANGNGEILICDQCIGLSISVITDPPRRSDSPVTKWVKI